MLRTIEEASDMELLESPYVYRTVRTNGQMVERVEDEVNDLRASFGAVFDRAANITESQITEAVCAVLARNHYPRQMTNAEVRLYNREGRAVVCVVAGRLLDSERYELSVIRPKGTLADIELPYTEHHTSLSKQLFALRREHRSMTLTRAGGAVVSCEGFPLYGVEQGQVVCYTPWRSVESARAEDLLERSGESLVHRSLTSDSLTLPEELFTFTTNCVVSLSHLDSRPLVPFAAYRLGRVLDNQQ